MTGRRQSRGRRQLRTGRERSVRSSCRTTTPRPLDMWPRCPSRRRRKQPTYGEEQSSTAVRVQRLENVRGQGKRWGTIYHQGTPLEDNVADIEDGKQPLVFAVVQVEIGLHARDFCIAVSTQSPHSLDRIGGTSIPNVGAVQIGKQV